MFVGGTWFHNVIVLFVPNNILLGTSDDSILRDDVTKLTQETNVIVIGIRGETDANFIEMISKNNANAVLINSYNDLDTAFTAVIKILCKL